MPALRIRTFIQFFVCLLVGAIFSSAVAIAWTGPTQTAPNGNVSAPINVGTTDQVKNAGLGVNSLAVFGNALLSGASRYFNFGTIVGSGGYGLRDNAGVMEFKDLGGSWANFSATTGRISGEIAAFDLTACPSGWTEYTQARGRFLRGIDNGAGDDPDGTRAPGSLQDDAFESHIHSIQTYPVSGTSNTDRVAVGRNGAGYQGLRPSEAAGGVETRPKNVAVLFCRKN